MSLSLPGVGARWARVALGLVASACLAAACGSDESERLGSPGAWLVECGPSAPCAFGDCVCGVCTEVCAGEAPGCGQPGSSCFTSGSLGYAAACEAGEAAGVCLPGCNADDDCGEGFTCAVGACLPSARLGQAESRVDEVARENGERFETTWFTFLAPPESVSPTCDDPTLCPTLEALLGRDACFEVRHGCGLTYLKARTGFVESFYHYWYDAFGAAPVAVVDAGTREARGTLPEACPIDVACSTCGQPSSTFSSVGTTLLGCEQVPRALPPPLPPALVDGCACELDDAGKASVSLDCFCSIYPCPAREDFVQACPTPDGSPDYSEQVVRDACGQVWFSTASYTGQRFSFDAASGELLGAVAFSQGPVTAPCGTYEVSAGSVRPCDVEETCNCWEDLYGQSCLTTPWYRAP